MMVNKMGRLLILVGVMLVILGLIINYFGKIPILGKLPGDISIERENFKFYFPITSGILISVLITIIIYIINRLRI
jgi:hypothetical protein